MQFDRNGCGISLLVRRCLLCLGVLATLIAAGVVPATAKSDKNLMVDGKGSAVVWINTAQGRFRFTAEIADEPHERQQGLMFRESMPADHGMLFIFDQTRVINMWMANTPLALDMIFIGKNGEVLKVAERTVPFSREIVSSERPASFVLELNAGVARMIGLKPGDRLEHAAFGTR